MKKDEHIILLNTIFYNLQQVTQWIPNNFEISTEYNNKAIALIEILEDDIFGNLRNSFKKGYKQKYKLTGYNTFDRFYYLIKELKCEKQIKKICYFDVENLHHYYNVLNDLRETFNLK